MKLRKRLLALTLALALGIWPQVAAAAPASFWGATCNANQYIQFGPFGVFGQAPVFQVDCSATNVATGLNVVGAAAGSGIDLAAISSGTNEALTLHGKGSGATGVGTSGTGDVILGNSTGLIRRSTATGVPIGGIYSLGGVSNLVANATVYYGVAGSATELNVSVPVAYAGTLTNLSVSTATSPSTGTATATIRVNGVDSTLTCTITATKCTDLTHTATVAVGDLIDIKAIGGSGATTSAAIQSSVILAY